jgi:hypothetical protein
LKKTNRIDSTLFSKQLWKIHLFESKVAIADEPWLNGSK